ncbi:MAG: hypothetical protein AAB693_00355 [Patescibacteria group bacterium]
MEDDDSNPMIENIEENELSVSRFVREEFLEKRLKKGLEFLREICTGKTVELTDLDTEN